MGLILNNENLTLHLDLPEENYQSTRFDWTGKIVQLIFKGKTLAGKEKEIGERASDGLGFYNEFGFDQPIGYEDTSTGEWFHKIGLGMLKKEQAVYHFSQSFELMPAKIEVTSTDTEVMFTCIGENHNGYGYRLVKKVALHEDGFSIHYQLYNTGDRQLRTNEYVHNFIALNETAINQNYELDFPFIIRPDQFIETINPEDAVRISNRGIRFHHGPTRAFYFSNLTGYEQKKASWRILHTSEKLSFSEQTDFKTDCVNLWGTGYVICPELFKQIDLPAGASDQWMRRYKVEEI
ncbi:MAG: hypothetical protein ACO2ZZ_11800 [Cyclobacteriaceae bacterium]